MRVGVITHTTKGRGGIEQVVAAQARGLRERGHHVRVFTGPELGSGGAARAVAAAGLALHPLARLRECDALVAHYPPSHLVARRSRRPFVHYLHHPLRAAHPTPTQQQDRGLTGRAWRAAGQLLAGADRRGVRAAGVVAVPSPSVGREAERLYDVRPEVLPLGIDTTVFRPRPGDAPAEQRLLFVGRPDAPYKHLDWALEVAERLDRPIDVVGDCRQRPQTRANVTWHGWQSGPALADHYRAAAALLFPSVQEDFGLVPLEAMACGLPVVGWDDGHGPSLTLAPGSGGLLVTPYDLAAFTSATADLLRQPSQYRRLAAAGPAWVQEHFSEQRHVQALESLLKRVASGNSP